MCDMCTRVRVCHVRACVLHAYVCMRVLPILVCMCAVHASVSCACMCGTCVVHAFVSCAYVHVCGAYLRVRVRGAYTCVGVSMSRGEMQTDVPWNERKLSLGEPEMDALNDKIL